MANILILSLLGVPFFFIENEMKMKRGLHDSFDLLYVI